jgi:predicted RNA-binding Zn-ribbon protein involved in translation (DUF1610 family)
MRQALVESIGTSTQDRYPRGSVVVCVSCGRPIYALERGLALGETMGRARSAFVPVSPDALLDLCARFDIDPGVRAHIRDIADLREYCETIPRPVAGSQADCPKCGRVFVQARSAERSDTTDRAYVWELTTIAPRGHKHTFLTGGDAWAPR